MIISTVNIFNLWYIFHLKRCLNQFPMQNYNVLSKSIIVILSLALNETEIFFGRFNINWNFSLLLIIVV